MSISDPTQTQKAMDNEDSHSDMRDPSGLEIPFDVQVEDVSHFLLGLKDQASIYQDTISNLMQSE